MSFWDAFTGAAQKKTLEESNRQATAQLGQGYDAAKGALDAGYSKGFGYVDPYVQQGQQDQTTYRNSLGLNGAAGAQQAQAQYQSARNPYADYQANQTTNALMRNYNARGMGMGGTAALAAARANNEQGYQDYSNWQSRLQGLGNQGYQASMTGANMATNQGSQNADLGWNYHNALAGNAISYGNALSQAQGIGVNNLFQTLNTGAKIASAAMGVPSR